MATIMKTFSDIIGQSRVVHLLSKWLQGAVAVGETLPSLLLLGPSGNGKTTLARALALEYGTEFISLHANSKMKPAQLMDALRQLEFGAILFIDEIQELKPATQAVLLPALESAVIADATGAFESISSFTLIAATNHPGRLLPALRTRLQPVELDEYSGNELEQIAEAVATRHGLQLSDEALELLATTSMGIPREIERRVTLLRLYWPGEKQLQRQHLITMLKSEGMDETGLRKPAQEYLRHLFEAPGSECTLETLTVRLGLDSFYLRTVIEPKLVEYGLVAITTSRRRSLALKGRAFVSKALLAEGATNSTGNLKSTKGIFGNIEKEKKKELAEEKPCSI